MASPNISNPFDEFNFPLKTINLSFKGNFFKGLIAGYNISQLFLCLKGSPSKNLSLTQLLTKYI